MNEEIDFDFEHAKEEYCNHYNDHFYPIPEPITITDVINVWLKVKEENQKRVLESIVRIMSMRGVI